MGGGCDLCPSARSRSRTRQHRDDPVQWCEGCGAYVCRKHVEWHDGWWCTRCTRQGLHRLGGDAA